MFICSDNSAPPDAPDVEPGCCEGSSYRGPDACTCWEPVYDLEQTPVSVDIPMPMPRDSMCGDCAFRKDSPERTGDLNYNGNESELEEMVEKGEPFYCHQGMRKVIGWRHPSGAYVENTFDGAYDPPITTHSNVQIPHKADASEGDICAGWFHRYERSRRGA